VGLGKARRELAAVGGSLSAAASDELTRDPDLPLRRRSEAELTGSHFYPGRRAQRRHLDLQLATEHLEPCSLSPQRVELVTEVDLLHAQPDDGQSTQDQEECASQRERERAPYAGIPLSMQLLCLSH